MFNYKTRKMIKNTNKTVNCYLTLNQSAIGLKANVKSFKQVINEQYREKIKRDLSLYFIPFKMTNYTENRMRFCNNSNSYRNSMTTRIKMLDFCLKTEWIKNTNLKSGIIKKP